MHPLKMANSSRAEPKLHFSIISLKSASAILVPCDMRQIEMTCYCLAERPIPPLPARDDNLSLIEWGRNSLLNTLSQFINTLSQFKDDVVKS